MACHGARRILEMNQNLAIIIGIEVLTAAQGISFRMPLKTSLPLGNVVDTLRMKVPRLEHDRYLADDIKFASELVLGGTLVGSVNSIDLPRL